MADEATIGKLLVEMLLDHEDYDAGIDGVKEKSKSLGVDLSGLADMLNSLVVGAFQAATAAAAGLAAASAYVGATFESKMTQVGVIAGASQDDLQALTDKARELGATTAFSASDAADAMQLLAGAGLDTNQVLDATGQALALAGAGGTKLDTAAAALTSTMAQFGLQADQAGRIADVFAASSAKSQFTVEDLSEAMKYGGTVGAGFGWSLEQTVAALAQFRDMGLQGSAAGTALRAAMVGATTASEKNVATLAKYGLTLADINPETHSFAEILTTVGKAGVNTTDAMVVFGNEAGAVVKSLSDKFAAGESTYQEMLDSLTGATGVAASMYEQMTDTVLGRLANVQSAAEEFLLTLFDQYAGPLADLLDAVVGVLNDITGAVQGQSETISGSLGGALGALTDWLNRNSAYIASSIASFISLVSDFAQEVSGVLPYLEAMLPLLDDLALTMGLVWVATKVAAFASAIGNVVAAINAAGGSLRGFMVVLTQATGGIYALVAAIGTLIAGLVYLINRYYEAETAANRLKEAQDRLKGEQAKQDEERLAKLDQILTAQQEAARLELENAEQLSAARRQELEQLTQLTAEEALRLEQQGKLVEVGGQLRTVSSVIDELDPDTVRALDAQIASLKTNASEAKDKIAEWEAGLKKAEAAMNEGRESTGAFVQTILQQAGITATSYEDAVAQVAALRQEQAQYASTAKALETERAKAVGDLRTSELRQVEATEQAKLSAAEKGLTSAGQKEKEYTDKVADLHRSLQAELAAQGATDLQRVDLEMQERVRKLRESYDEQIKAAGDNAAEVARLEAQFQQDNLTLLAIWSGERQKIIDASAKEEADKRKAEAERVQGIIMDLEEEGLAESVRLEREKAEVLAGIGEEYGDEKARIAALYDKKITDAQAEEEADRQDNTESWLEKFEGAMADTAATVGDIIDGMATAWDSFTGAIDTVMGTASDFVSFFADGLEALTGFSFDLFDAIEAVVAGMEEAQENAIEMTGPGGATMSVAGPGADVGVQSASYVGGLVDAAVAFVEAAVEAVPLLIQALVEKLPTLIDALVSAIPQVIKSLVAAIPEVIDMFVTEAPRVIEALVAGLPTLVQGLVDALPRIIDFIIEQLPTVVMAMIDQVQVIMDALISELPRLLIAIVEMIPTIVQDILAHLPSVITGLISGIAQVIVAIIEAIPEIIDNLLTALPDIITSLLDALIEAIPTIIMALVEAIPQIIISLVTNIPKIINSILSKIPDIIYMIISLIPDIITGFIEAIPDLLVALVNSIPDMIQMAIVYLPEIIIALLDAFLIQLPQALPEIAISLVTAIIDALKQAWDALVQVIGDLFAAAWEAITDLFSGDKDKGSAYSGINYVPATMKMTLHPGEAVIPANRNPAGRGNRADPALAGGRGGTSGGGGMKAELAILVNGKVVEGALLESAARGQAVQLKRMVRTTAGVKAGLDRGQYNRWNK